MRIIRSRQETRERILQATERLLDQNSALKFQIRDVAKEAGVSASLIIQYFSSKNDLVFEAAVRRLGALGPDLAPILETGEPSLDTVLEAFFASDYAASHIVRDLMSLSWWWSVREEQRVEEVFRPRIEAISAALSRAGAEPTADRVQGVLAAYLAGLRSALVAVEDPGDALRRIKAAAAIAAG